MKAPCAQPATSILLRTKPPCAQSATPPRVASRAGCPASQHRASARLADGGAHYRPKGTEFPRKPCLWADNAPAEAATPPASIASRPISLRPPAEMFHVKHLYGTRVSLSSMLLACDVLSNALKSATCDVRRIKSAFQTMLSKKLPSFLQALQSRSGVFQNKRNRSKSRFQQDVAYRAFLCESAQFSCANPDRVLSMSQSAFEGLPVFHVKHPYVFVIRRSALQTLTCGDNRRLAADAAKKHPEVG